jgi:hypothetical protein
VRTARLLLALGGSTVFSKGFGMASYELDVPMRNDHRQVQHLAEYPLQCLHALAKACGARLGKQQPLHIPQEQAGWHARVLCILSSLILLSLLLLLLLLVCMSHKQVPHWQQHQALHSCGSLAAAPRWQAQRV